MHGFTLGGSTAWRVRAKGDLVAAFHWYQDEPTLFIFPRYSRLMVNNIVPYGLPLSVAHELVEDGVAGRPDLKVLLDKAATAGQLMGMDDPKSIHRIADLMLECLDDLCDMPPTPAAFRAQQARQQGKPDGVIQLRADGKTVFEGTA